MTLPASRSRVEPHFPALALGAQAGAGFKPEHFAEIEASPRVAGFFEVHAENYMGDGGMPHRILSRLRETYPLSIHGVCMSIGGPEPLDRDHLQRFSALVARYEPMLVSEHLAWSSHDDVFLSDLLPLPYTDETLTHVCLHLDEVQEAIGRPILLENPATYLAFEESSWMETDFLREIARRTGCGLLLDVNNVFVASTNQGVSPMTYLADFPLEAVGEIHLGGHDAQTDDTGAPLLIDSHDRPVADPVWQLYDTLVRQCGPLPTLVEWDNDVPTWPVLAGEVAAAQAVLDRHSTDYLMGRRHA